MRTLTIILALLLSLVIFPAFTHAQKQTDFQEWLLKLRAEALADGISPATLDRVISKIQLLPRVKELDQSQPEFRLTVKEYLDRVVPDSRILNGRKALEQNRDLLNGMYRIYGVQPPILLALWGIETDFGRSIGDFLVIDAVATLAYQGRRAAFFRRELLHALRIVDQGHIPPEEMKGSWAGAMGQVQFMPSSFQNFAVDYDGDGLKDIWNSLPDAFASAANYLSESGWMRNESWGIEAGLPADLSPALVGLEVRKPLREWESAGVRFAKKKEFSDDPTLLWSIVAPDGPKNTAYLVNNNYRVFLRWNRSHHFAIAVGTLADRIADR